MCRGLGSRARTIALSSTVPFFICLIRDQLGQFLAGDVTWAHRGEQRLGLQRGGVLLRPSRKQFSQQRVEPVDGLDPAPTQGIAAVGERPQRFELTVEGKNPQGLVRTATTGIECAPRASVLRLCTVSKSRTRAASLAGTSRTSCRPPAPAARGRPAPLEPSSAQVRCGHAFAQVRIAA